MATTDSGGKTIILLGLAGAGGYVLYEYFQYSSEIDKVIAARAAPGTSASDVSAAKAGIEQGLPFFTYLALKWGITSGTTQLQQAAFTTLTQGFPQQSAQPGTTSTSQPTSVTTAPPS